MQFDIQPFDNAVPDGAGRQPFVEQRQRLFRSQPDETGESRQSGPAETRTETLPVAAAIVVDSLGDHYRSEMLNAQRRIAELELKLAALVERIPQKYPAVTYLNYKSRKRVLVTGGAGFVGSHLVDQLMMQGHEIIVADNFFTGRKRNVEHWLGHENFELIHHDIVNPLFIEVDEIYHLASPASPPHYMHNPVKTIKTNTMGTINMLGLAKRVGAKVLIASTSEVYGDPDVHPQPETYWGHVNPIGPRACYDEGKRVSETLSYAYAKQEHVKVRVARIFNTYGPRMHMNDGRVVSNFILQALQNESITVSEWWWVFTSARGCLNWLQSN